MMKEIIIGGIIILIMALGIKFLLVWTDNMENQVKTNINTLYLNNK